MRKFYFVFLLAALLSLTSFGQITTLNEGFESGIPSDWLNVNNGADDIWTTTTGYHYTGQSAAYMSDGANCNAFLITPQLNITDNASVLSFWFMGTYVSYSYGNTFTIEVSTTGTAVSDFTVVQTLTYPSSNNTWEERTVDLSDYIGEDIYIAFHIINNNMAGTVIDDISLAACKNPSSPVVSNITGHQAQISWEGNETNNYTLQYKQNSSSDWEEITGATSPVTLSDLQPETQYNVRVILNCSEDDEQYISVTNNFTTDISCPAPVITVSEVTTETATVSWVGDATDYTLRYKISGSSDYIAEDIALEGNTYSLTGLSASVSYTVEVSAICQDGDNSQYGSKSFMTACDVITNLPTEDDVWFEDFEGYDGDGEEEFQCWTTPVKDVQYHGPFVYCGYSQSCHSGSNSAELKGAKNMLVLPEFSQDIHDLRLTFWSTATSTSVGTLEVGIVTDAEDSTTFELVAVCQTPAPRNNAAVPGAGNLQGPFDFAGVQAESGRIALRYTSNSASQSWNLDDFTVSLIPACAEPTALNVSNIAGHSAQLSWVSNAESVVVAYKSNGEDEWNEVEATENPYTLTGLASETTFTVKVGNNCMNGTVAYSAEKTFTTDISCPAPNVSVSGQTENTAELSWSGDAEDYTLKCKLYGTDTWILEETVQGNTYTLTDLAASSNYSVEIVANCSDEDGSSQAGTITFRTECATVTEYPYNESFETLTSSDWGCWTRENAVSTSSTVWTIESGSEAQDGNKCAYMGYNSGSACRLISPILDLSSLSTPYLTFYYQTLEWYSNASKLSVFYKLSESDDWTQIGSAFETATSGWTYEEMALPEGTTRVMFLGEGNNGDGIYLDNISIKAIDCGAPGAVSLSGITGHTVSVAWSGDATQIEYMVNGGEWTLVDVSDSPNTITGLLPETEYTLRVGLQCESGEMSYSQYKTFTTDIACPVPNLTVSGQTESTAELSWTGDAEEYILKLKPYGADEWILEETVQGNTYTLTDLAASSNYSVEIIANCSEEDGLSQTGSATFRTECNTVTEFPYNESFETSTTNDWGCWTATGEIYTDNNASDAQDGNKYAYLTSFYSTETATLVSPVFDLSSLSSPYVTFYYSATTLYQGYGAPGTLKVYYRTAATETWTQIGSSYEEGTSGWVLETLALPNPSETYQIKFELGGTIYSQISLDNIYIKNIDCAAPSGVTLENITGHTVDVAWLGDATVIDYRQAGETEWASVDVSDSPFTLNSLEAETDYVLRVGVDCGTGSVSYSPNKSFTTDIACPAPIISVTNVSETQAEISWVSEASDFVLRYKNSGSSTWIEDNIQISGYSYTISDLSSATSYTVEVAAQCDGDDNSLSPYGSKNFSTTCGIITSLPWTEDFEGYTSTGANEFICWAVPVTSVVDNGVAPFVYVGHAQSCHSGMNSAEMKGANGMAVLPEFSEDIHNLRLTFYSTATVPSSGTLEVGVVTDANDTSTFELVATCVTPANRGTQEGVAGNGNLQGPFDFANVQAESGRIALRYVSSNPSQSWNLDDFMVQIAPACAEPTSLSVNNVAGHSAQLSWISPAETLTVSYKADNDGDWSQVTATENPYILTGLESETHYTVKVGRTCDDASVSWSAEQSFTTDISCPVPVLTLIGVSEDEAVISWTGDAETYELKYKEVASEDWITESVEGNTYTIPSLQSSSSYTLELRANCGDEDGMSQAGTLSFTTACLTITDFPYTETFETGLGCWISNPTYGNSEWTVKTAYNGSNTPSDISSFAQAYYEGSGNVTDLISPVFDLSSQTNPTLKFSHIQTNWSGDQDALYVYYKTSADADRILLTSFTNDISSWTEEEIALPNATETYQIIFEAHLNYGHGVGLDNISVLSSDGDTVNPVVLPVVVTNQAGDVAQNSATLNGEIVSQGTETIVSRGFEWKETNGGAYTVVTVMGTNMTYSLTGLNPNTSYTYRAFASTADVTVYGDEVTFQTLVFGLEDIASSLSVSLYPNPASDNSVLVVKGLNGQANIVITDQQGKIVSKGRLEKGTEIFNIDVTTLPSGVYYVRVQTSDSVRTEKLIKK
ncbi:MAG: fibronectin type III domain-containing protein [Bacteroidales bacterium]|nr:fibronectin type III domain-containing protein [Bacteroidales bacterium]